MRWSTNKLWIAANRTLTDLERPYISVFGPYKLKLDSKVSGGFVPFARYIIANYGRTPATVESIRGGFSIARDRPPDALEDASTAWRMRRPIYPPAGERKFSESLPDGTNHVQHTEHEITPVLELDQYLFLRIIVKYRGPFTGPHETAACWVLNDRNRFEEFGGKEYNYEK